MKSEGNKRERICFSARELVEALIDAGTFEGRIPEDPCDKPGFVLQIGGSLIPVDQPDAPVFAIHYFPMGGNWPEGALHGFDDEPLPSGDAY